jgi:hypothetical protein
MSPPILFILFKIVLTILYYCSTKIYNQLVNFYKEVSWDSEQDGIKSLDNIGEFHHLKNVRSSSL